MGNGDEPLELLKCADGRLPVFKDEEQGEEEDDDDKAAELALTLLDF